MAPPTLKYSINCGNIYCFKNYGHDLVSLPKRYLNNAWSVQQCNGVKAKCHRKVQAAIPFKPWFNK